MPFATLLERASRCVICKKLMGRPSEADLKKLEDVERENGQIEFLCQPCNDGFVEWWRARHGEDPTPTCILGRMN